MKLNFNIGDLFKSFKKGGKKQGGGDRTVAMPEFDSDLGESGLGDPPSEEMLDIGGPGNFDGDLGADPTASLAATDEPIANAGKKRAVLLLLLLIILGGGYFAMSGGLLEPILQMAGLAEPEPAPAPVAKPRSRTKIAAKPAKKTAVAAKPAAAPKAATTPKKSAKPVSGTIAGKPFSPDWVEYRRGLLVLRQGKASAPKHEIKLTVPHEAWELPAGKKFESGMFSSAEIILITDGSNEQIISKGVDLELKFDKVVGDALTGTIKLSAKEPVAFEINGAVNAVATGFRTVNGEPVLTSDADETLMYVALRHLLKKEPTKSISNAAYRDTSFKPKGRPRTGSLVMEYASGNQSVSRTFTFKKTKKGWQVSRMTAEK
ncbi:MAG: hypothetical protein IME93_02175 [Proteobacteria bacterium]|nr:hypothetical protein [Pseudomonadota bacterium]